jgi:hypothetical protein
MPFMCFSYPSDVPPGIGNCDAVQPDPRRMPFACFSDPIMCFSYPSDVPLGTRNGDVAPPPLPGLRRMPYSCFSY